MRNIANPAEHAALDERKLALEDELRARWAGGDRAAIKALPVIGAYDRYYRKFKKTYHVRLQLESVALKGRPIPRVAALVESMFMAELKNLLLTAGHDLDAVEGPVTLDVSDGTQRYELMNGSEQQTAEGDMTISDSHGVISSIIYGPDRRTRIGPGTRSTLFTVYAPEGVGEQAVRGHLGDIRDNVLLVAPDGQTEALEVAGAG
jgi:DNA/RNA-binding domain of Phe-tRNA-synthetase-like protein